MSKSYAQMADEILNGALTDSTKNPYDPAQGHQASLPAMNPADRLVEMNDTQRAMLMGHAGVQVEEIKEERIVESVEEPPVQQPLITEQDLHILNEAKRIIAQIQEMTSVGSIGVNMAGPSGDAKKVKLPGPDYKKPQPKKRAKVRAKKENDFLSRLKA